MDRYRSPCRAFLCIALLIGMILTWGCAPGDAGSPVLSAEMPLHLEEHLDVATIEGSDVPEDIAQAVEWYFDEPRPEWRVAELEPWYPEQRPTELSQLEDAIRISVGDVDVTDDDNNEAIGGIYVDLRDRERDDWTHIRVRARSEADVDQMTVLLGLNLREESDAEEEDGEGPVEFLGERATVIRDGTVQTYNLRAWSEGPWEGPWKQLALGFMADREASIDILSVTLVSKEETYAEQPVGVQNEVRNRAYRRALYTHAPGRVEYRVRVPEAGRLDVGLGVLREDAPMTFSVTATSGGGEPEPLLRETYNDVENWGQRSIDLSHLAGQTVALSLEADSPKPGTVALWAAPTMSGVTVPSKPNVVFYIIDGGAAELMSVYGYNRRTTPNIERLAAEGAVFEQAYSNATWTNPSTPSFMTSLQTSVLASSDPLPEQAVTMAEYMHRGGYQTAVFTANPYAGTMNSLDRGVDVLRDTWDESMNHSASSAWLQEAFWEWREAYPAQPYWVHFQTVDSHVPWSPVPPFTGLFGSVDAAQRIADWVSKLEEGGLGFRAAIRTAMPPARLVEFFERAGIDPLEFFSVSQGLYDEGMAHTDYQIGRLVNRIKAAGEWDNTIFILAADHSHDNAGLKSMASMAAPVWHEQAIFSPWESRIPMIVVWPGRIAAGQRFTEPVSMIDMLPTIVDLAGLPRPEITQGQSLAPLLLGQEGWEPRPVILAEFYGDVYPDTIFGRIDVVDGRWGASLLVNREPSPPEKNGRAAPLLLFDLWNDPYVSHSLHEERPDLVDKYTEFLEAQFAAHRALAQRFTRSGEGVPWTPEQIETLRTLGYIQ